MGRHNVFSLISAMRWVTFLCLLCDSLAYALAVKHETHFELPDKPDTIFTNASFLQPRADSKPFTLRIMPLGASITAGYGTTLSRGYRKPLRDQLRWRGWPVNMIGSQRSDNTSTFHNNQHEGHGGHTVDETIEDSNGSLYRKPNLVLINCGTNDVPLSTWETTGTTMQGVLDHLFNEIDGVTVILSTIVPRLDSTENTRRSGVISEQYRNLVKDNAASGRKILLADLAGVLNPGSDYYDDLHPNDIGAAKFAAVWDKAILEAENKKFLTTPIDTGTPDVSNEDDTTDGRCPVVRGALRGPVKTQSGWGYDDGTYAHKDAPVEGLATRNSIWDSKRDNESDIYFAQLVNGGNADFGDYLDELIVCTEGPNHEGAGCSFLTNTDGSYDKGDLQKLELGLFCHLRGLHFGDINGDGLDDVICINLEAKMYAAINKGGNPPTFDVLPDGGLIRGAGNDQTCDSQSQVRLGDMDGDGRLDYCCIDGKGDIYCWRNGGSGRAPVVKENGYWQELVGGATFKAKGETQGIDGVRFVDINGDGRTDWVYLHNDGTSDIYVNQRGSISEDGKGLAPHWAKASSTHTAYKEIDYRHNFYFGRVKPRSFRADGGPTRADRIILHRIGFHEDDESYSADLKIQTNLGVGGTKLKGDGVFYCDMFGSGSDDYLWVLSTGAITLFQNIHSPPAWGPLGEIIDIKRDRKSIHFGDWDGDGKCDILAVERHTGRVEWWRNLHKTGDKVPTFADPQWAVDTAYDHRCTEGWGNGVYDYGLEFADLDGDKRVDYICMEKNMRVFGTLNKAGELQWKDQIKLAPDNGTLDRANFKWADVDGDGKADLIWVDKFDGKGRLWTNGGFTPAAGSSMTWDYQGFRFDGHGRGQNIHFPKIGTSGRADYHVVWPDTAISDTYFNDCSRQGEGQDDYPEPFDPNLPTLPGGGVGTGDFPTDRLDYAKSEYQGIYWDRVTKGCTGDEFLTILETLEESVNLMRDQEHENNGYSGWNEFFLNSQQWNSREAPQGKYGIQYEHIAFILHKMRQYPVFGPSPLKKGELYSIGFLCGDAGPYHECRDTPGTAAWTAQIVCESIRDSDCLVIGFCPRFFRREDHDIQPRHISDIIHHSFAPPEEFGNLENFERTMIHEFAHAYGYRALLGRVIDIHDSTEVGSPFMHDIYGAFLAHKYAWKFVSPSTPDEVNPKTVLNADNYALFATYQAFANGWGWDVDLASSIYDAWEKADLGIGPGQLNVADNVTIPDLGLSTGGCRMSTGPKGEEEFDCSNVTEFKAPSGCTLTIACTFAAPGRVIDPDCVCTCDGQQVDSKDARCADLRRDPQI